MLQLEWTEAVKKDLHWPAYLFLYCK